MSTHVIKVSALRAAALFAMPSPLTAQTAACPVTHDKLAEALRASAKRSGGPGNGGFDNNMVGCRRLTGRDNLSGRV